MRILVTGANGQVSRSLQRRASHHDALEVIALGRAALDLEEPGSATRAIAGLRPDVVINAAAYTAVDQAEDEPGCAGRINAEGAGEIAAAARESGTPLIQISTDFVFDGRTARAYDEQAGTNPLNVYGCTKLAGEHAVRAATPEHLIVRTAWVHSPFGRNFVRTMMEAARTRNLLRVVDDQIGSPTSALDLADGLLIVCNAWREGRKTGLGETYHLAGSGLTSWFGLARAVMEECAELELPHAVVEPITTADWPTKAVRPPFSALDSSRFARNFGFVMPHWRQSLREVVQGLAT